MTYTFSKEHGWIGYCDNCKLPFEPHTINLSLEWDINRMNKQTDVDLKDMECKGWCVGCNNLSDKYIASREGTFVMMGKVRLV